MKTKIRHIIFIVALCSLSATLAGCKNGIINKLKGRWKMEQMVANPTSEIYWTFDSDDKLVIENDYNCCTADTVVGEYKYKVVNLLTPTVEIKSPLGLGGKWRIEKSTKKILVMTRVNLPDKSTGGAYLRREFTKQ